MSSPGNRPVASALMNTFPRPLVSSAPLCWKITHNSPGVSDDRWGFKERTNSRIAAMFHPRLHAGHPLPLWVRFEMIASYECPSGHVHHALSWLLDATPSGVRSPFFE